MAKRDLGFTPEFSAGWKMAQRWPILFLIPFGITAWVTFAYLAYVLKRWYLYLFAVLYTSPAVVGLVFSYVNFGNENVNAFTSDAIFNAVLVGWLFSMVHTGFLWKDYMYDRMAKKRARNAEEEQLKADGEKELWQ